MKKIPLTRGKYAIVDDEDYEWLTQWSWCYNNRYAIRGMSRGGVQKKFPMHREIMKTPIGLETDHINGNTLDNRKSNLRICTHKENGRNRKVSKNKKWSEYKGVTYRTDRRVWITQIRKDNRLYKVGYFKNELEAALTYDIWAVKFFGKYAKLNFNAKGAAI